MVEQSESNISSNNNEPPLVYRIKQYKAKSLLQQFSFMLIRPPRFLYNSDLLNPPIEYQKVFKVQQHQIPFKLTLYKVANMMYVILYLHGNSSSRFEGYMHLRELPEGVGLACFDFSGCGMREDSDFITLGCKQSKQVDVAARYLKNLGHKVVGWGRSMGSVSLLLSSQCDVMVADSPFYSLSTLCKESTKSFIPSFCCCLFYCLYPCLFSCVKSDVKKKAEFDIQAMEIAKSIVQNPRNKDRSLFIMAGKQDQVIPYYHSEKIYEIFPGVKHIQLFDGSHNSTRSDAVVKKCFGFVEKQLGIDRSKRMRKILGLGAIQQKYELLLKKYQQKKEEEAVKIVENEQNIQACEQTTEMNLLSGIKTPNLRQQESIPKLNTMSTPNLLRIQQKNKQIELVSMNNFNCKQNEKKEEQSSNVKKTDDKTFDLTTEQNAIDTNKQEIKQ